MFLVSLLCLCLNRMVCIRFIFLSFWDVSWMPKLLPAKFFRTSVYQKFSIVPTAQLFLGFPSEDLLKFFIKINIQKLKTLKKYNKQLYTFHLDLTVNILPNLFHPFSHTFSLSLSHLGIGCRHLMLSRCPKISSMYFLRMIKFSCKTHHYHN